MATLFTRLLFGVRRASEAVRVGIVVALLAVSYVVVLPWIALARALSPAARGRRGLARRDDPEVGSLERLRRTY